MKRLDDLVRDHVTKALKKYKTQDRAAAVLGICPRTIRNYLTKWGVERKRKTIADCIEPLTAEQRDYFESRNWGG